MLVRANKTMQEVVEDTEGNFKKERKWGESKLLGTGYLTELADGYAWLWDVKNLTLLEAFINVTILLEEKRMLAKSPHGT